jgi:dihydroorotase-like cyclic amidohydrolase
VYDLILRDATVFSSGGRRVLDLALADGRIAYMGNNPGGPAREEVSCIGRFVLPGLIDCLAYVGSTPNALHTLGISAIHGGITSMVVLPERPNMALGAPPTIDWARWAHPEEYSSEGDFLGPFLDLQEATAAGPAMGGAAANVEAWTTALSTFPAGRPGLLWHRSPEHSDSLVEAMRLSKLPLYLGSLGDGPLQARLDGLRRPGGLSVGLSLPHLTFSADALGPEATEIRLDPPLRGELDRKALWAALKRGRIDALHSAHRSLSRAERLSGQTGVPSLSRMLPILLAGVKHGRLGMERLIEVCCEGPARILGLAHKGRLEVGADADLLLVHEGATRRAEGVEGEPTGCPYEGREVGLAPQLVLSRGRVLARDGRLEPTLPSGRSLIPRP